MFNHLFDIPKLTPTSLAKLVVLEKVVSLETRADRMSLSLSLNSLIGAEFPNLDSFLQSLNSPYFTSQLEFTYIMVATQVDKTVDVITNFFPAVTEAAAISSTLHAFVYAFKLLYADLSLQDKLSLVTRFEKYICGYSVLEEEQPRLYDPVTDCTSEHYKEYFNFISEKYVNCEWESLQESS